MLHHPFSNAECGLAAFKIELLRPEFYNVLTRCYRKLCAENAARKKGGKRSELAEIPGESATLADPARLLIRQGGHKEP